MYNNSLRNFTTTKENHIRVVESGRNIYHTKCEKQLQTTVAQMQTKIQKTFGPTGLTGISRSDR